MKRHAAMLEWMVLSVLLSACGEYTSSPTADVPPHGRLAYSEMSCFYAAGATRPGATVEYVLETFQEATALHARLTLDPSFVDNSYGDAAIGWNRGHAFKELVGSDHAELVFTDAASTDLLDIKMDYLSANDSAPSGFATAGISGGDGKLLQGEASDVLSVTTSLDRNLNELGYSEYVSASPVTDAAYDPNPLAPQWDFRVVYDVWVDRQAFGVEGFGSVRLDFLHASPSKLGSNTVDVTDAPCPDDWCPGGCENVPGGASGSEGASTSEDPGPGASDAPMDSPAT